MFKKINLVNFLVNYKKLNKYKIKKNILNIKGTKIDRLALVNSLLASLNVGQIRVMTIFLYIFIF